MENENRIYIAMEEGAGPFHAPVACRRLPNGSYEILPDDLFDYEDDSQLFAFGPGDIVLVRSEHMGKERTACLVARELQKSGSDINDFKRLLFHILEEKPDPPSVITKYGKDAVRRLLLEGHRGGFLYPAIREWISLHRQALEESL